MTIEDDAIRAIEDVQTERTRNLREVLLDDKYELVGANHDPANGSYIIMAERDPKMSTATAFKEMGYTSLSPWTAWTREEQIPELRDKQGIRTYYEMKRADGTVRGALRYVKTPVMAARWFMEPASDSVLDHNIATFVEDNLFNNLNVPWSRIVEDALLMCEYGYLPMEKVYGQDSDGRIVIKKLAPRHPLDIREWIYDANGGPETLIMEPTEATGWIQLEIPIAKLVVFVLEQEAGDLRGISLLRSAYKHYFYKDCKSEDTEILTQRGWLFHNQLIQGDMVLTINPETGMSEWNEVQYIRRYPGTHDVIHMESQQISSISTPDHRWLTKDTTWKAPYTFVTTENLRQRHIIPRAAVNADIPTEPKYTDDLVELIGWFITEGGWQGYGSAIAQNYDQPFFDRIRTCLTGVFGPAYAPDRTNVGHGRLPAGWYEHTKKHDPNGCQFRLNANATKLLSNFVKGKNKVVTTNFILSLTKAQLELFVTTCLRGDGCTNSEIRQNDKPRLEPIALACMLLGWGVNYKSWNHQDPDYQHAIVHQLLISRERVGAKPLQSASRYGSKIERTTYTGIVWCPKTKNGTWLARRNGKVYFTGNTFYKIDSIQKERHGIGVPIIKLPMGFSKADRAIAEDLGRNLRTNERAHIVAPESWTIEFAKLEGQPVDCLTSIAHHDMKIYENILAPFANDPNAKEDSMSMFFKSTRYIANTVADTFNKYVIKQLVDFNFARGKYPKLRARRIGEWEDLRTMSFAYRNFVGANSIIPDERLEDFLRREMDLPPAEHETRRFTTASPQAAQPMTSDEGARTATGSDVAPPKPARVGPPRQSNPAVPSVGNQTTGVDKSGTSGTR